MEKLRVLLIGAAFSADLHSDGYSRLLDKVQIVGFGTFSVREREEHEARNPSTGEPVTVAASKTPVFKPGKSFKEAF